jgi:hypothetical protein
MGATDKRRLGKPRAGVGMAAAEGVAPSGISIWECMRKQQDCRLATEADMIRQSCRLR